MFLFVPLALLLPLLECAAVLPVAKDAAALGPYRMREVLLDTEWTEKVAKDPWPEYPRPQLRRKHWKSLNGIWKHSSATGNQMHETSTVNGEMALLLGGAEVLVPFCLESALSGKCLCFPSLNSRLTDDARYLSKAPAGKEFLVQTWLPA